MAAIVRYKGAPLTSVENATKTLQTAGKYMEDDIQIQDVSRPSPTLQTKSVTPSETAQAITPDQNYDALSRVDVGAIPGNYVGSQIPRKDSTDLSVDDDTVSGPAGYYPQAVSKSVASGTEGTPTATKGQVSNHAITVTPSVTNTKGYIQGGTHSGAGVQVTASELVSGSETKTQNGTYDVTNLAEVVVAVEGGGGATPHKVIFAEFYENDDSTPVFESDDVIDNPQAWIVFSIDTINSPTAGTLTAIIHDNAGTRAYYYDTNGNVTVNDDSSWYITTPWGRNDHHVGLKCNLYDTHINGSGAGYAMILIQGGDDEVTFRTASYQPPSGVVAGQFSVEENPPLYFCALDSSVAANQYHRVQTVVKADVDDVDVFSGTNFYTNTLGYYEDFTESYSNGTLTITSSGTNNGGYFHNPGTYTLYYLTEEDLDGTGGLYQSKTVTPTTLQQVVEADTGYEALKRVTVEPIPSQYIVPSGNKAIASNGDNIDVAAYSTVSVQVPSGGSPASVDIKTVTNSSSSATSLSFTGLLGEPIAFFIRCLGSLTRSSNSSYYYIADIVYDGTNTKGNSYRMSNGNYAQVASNGGYSFTYNNGTLTVSTSGSRTALPGSFYNSQYELVYVYQ